MPFGWNAEMAVQQGFGNEISIVENKKIKVGKSLTNFYKENLQKHI